MIGKNNNTRFMGKTRLIIVASINNLFRNQTRIGGPVCLPFLKTGFNSKKHEKQEIHVRVSVYFFIFFNVIKIGPVNKHKKLSVHSLRTEPMVEPD